MSETILKTKFQLRFDTLTNWQSTATADKGANLILKQGEVAICQVPANATAVSGDAARPQYLMKVGDGTTAFKDLPWISAKAADVYAWAKKSGIDVQDNGTGKFVTGFSWNTTTDSLIVTRSNVSSSDIGDLQTLLNAKADKVVNATAGNIVTLDANGNIIDSGKRFVTTMPEESSTNDEVPTELAVYNFVTSQIQSEQVARMLADHGLQEAIDKKIETITGSKAIEATTTGTDFKTTDISLKINNTATKGNVTLSQDANGLKAQVEIPSATVTGVKAGEKIISLSGTELMSTLAVGYDSTTKKIQLKGIGNAVISEFDASAFIKDGMVSNVTFDPTTKELTITFNTDAGKEDVKVDMSSLVDTYTGGKNVKVENYVISSSGIVEATNGAVSVTGGGTGSDTDFSIGVKVKSTDKYIGITNDEIATKGIDDAISAAVSPVETGAKKIKVESASSNGSISFTDYNGTKTDVKAYDDQGIIARVSTIEQNYVQSITADNGLKISNVDSQNPNVTIDDSVVFVLNGGTATSDY